jgi:hypothetical protein
MSTTSLQKRTSSGALAIRKYIGKFEALLFLPKLARAILRFDTNGELVADDNPFPFAVKAAAYTAVAGDKLAVNTTDAAVTITLPASPSAGDTVEMIDAANTFDTNNLTVGRNGANINSAGSNLTVSTEGARVLLVYINSTIGWKAMYLAAAADSLAVTNNATIGGTLGVTGNVAVNTDKFTVTAASGNTAVGGTLAVTGITTFSERQRLATIASPVAATGAGGGVAGAAQLGNGNELYVSSDGATKGVKLPTGVAGDVVTIHNTSSTACNLFAASGGTINGGSADAGCTIPASKGVRAHCSAADTWTVYDLTAKAGAAA